MYRNSYNEIDQIGKWISIDKWTKHSWGILYPERNEAPLWHVAKENMVYTTRYYELFAILANERNPDNIPHISDHRGVPEDVTPEIPPQLVSSECHSTTWFTAKELFDFEWDRVYEYEYEDEDWDGVKTGEIIKESVDYMESGRDFLEVAKRIVGKNDPADFRFIIAFDS
jgi:hypothetical protein